MIYPKHIYDPLRRRIAEEFLEHELRKMFPSIRDGDNWKKMDSDVADWFENNNTMAPVRDFWNGFHGISRGFKLTALIYRLTSENIKWTKRQLAIDDLWFVTRGNRGLQVFDEAPSVREVKEYYASSQNLGAKKQLKKELEDKQVLEIVRDDDPIIVMNDGDRKIIIDGNHRVLRRLLRDESEVWAYVGLKMGDPMIFNPWVPTQLILDIKALAMHTENVDVYARVIFDLIKDSKAGQIEFATRSLNRYRKFDLVMYRAVKKLCNENSVDLPDGQYWS